MSSAIYVQRNYTYINLLSDLRQPNTFGKYDFPPKLFLVLIAYLPSAAAIYHSRQLSETCRLM